MSQSERERALLAAIDQAEETSYGSDVEGDLDAERAEALDLYLGNNTMPVPAGRSQVVDRSVFESVQWILPSLTRIFAGGGDLVSIPPIGPDDEEGAKQEAEVVNWTITQKNPWFDLFQSWATDALTLRNGYAIAYLDRVKLTEVERYERQTEEGVAMLLDEQGVEVLSSKQYPDPEAKPEPMLGPDGQPMLGPDGQSLVAPPAMLYDLEIRRSEERRKVCIDVLPPERVKVGEYTPSWRLTGCPYFEWWEMRTLSDLRAEGFDVPDDISDASGTEDSLTDEARDRGHDSSAGDRTTDPAMRRVKTRRIWIQHDWDGDGIAELQYVVRVGSTILLRDEVSSIPVAGLVPLPMAHRHLGYSIGDMVGDLQKIKTAILRQGLDNLYRVNNPQRVVDKNLVNMEDLRVSVPGGYIRVDGNVNAVRYEQTPSVFADVMNAAEYIDQMRENRVGVNRYFTGLDANALNKTATGVQTLSAMAAQRVEQIARIMAFGVEDLARIVHELLLKAGHKAEAVKLRGKWVEVDPATWRKRSDFRISVGFASGNKDLLTNRLMLLSQQQYTAAQAGLPIVRPENVYETMLELTKASDFSSPERFWTDPSQAGEQAPQPDPNLIKVEADTRIKMAELEQQEKEAEREAQLKAAELQMQEREAQAKLAIENYRIDKEAEVKIAIAMMQAEQARELEALRAEAAERLDERRGVRELERDAMQRDAEPEDEGEGKLDVLASQLSEQVKATQELAKALLAATTARRKVVRGKDGRVETVEIEVPK